MIYEDAVKLKSFKHYCTCGGYNWQQNGRKEEQPHMAYCPQYEEYAEWYKAIKSKEHK